ncbi:MAG: NAD(P)/FAD-dependent oxidoreductase [Clostridia bacterium]|nr:NAD(P)/FAD-dependent oxidoreductase [Clostridia bacterium]
MKLAIIGGGAAGLAAAVFCARRVGGEHVIVFEKQPRVGKKLLATGNGTCNLSNVHAAVEHYHGQTPSFVQAALSGFSPDDARAFFDSLGVPTVVRDNGRIYPLCAQASAVLDCLRLELTRLGVQTVCDTAVTALKPRKNGVSVCTDTQVYEARCALVAAGGAASASLGGSVDGYRLLTDLGHKKHRCFPPLCRSAPNATRSRRSKDFAPTRC